MLVVAGFALRALVRPRGQGQGGLDSLAIIAAGIMVGYNVFLFATYLAVFQGWEAEHVASYWRYNTHVGLVGTAFAVYGGAILWRRHPAARLALRGPGVVVGPRPLLLPLGPGPP